VARGAQDRLEGEPAGRGDGRGLWGRSSRSTSNRRHLATVEGLSIVRI
jgi:hypothetical protein